MRIDDVQFVGSYADHTKSPRDHLPAVAIIGRSNVGKSSLINMLTSRKRLARVSAVPGKTQLINYFLVDSSWHLVDLPGYGWAKVGKGCRKVWHTMVRSYLRYAPSLVHILLLIDSRHAPQMLDIAFAKWMQGYTLPFSIVFTKKDKVAGRLLAMHQRALWAALGEEVPHCTTSARGRVGREGLLAKLGEVVHCPGGRISV